jgi:hypothetical protein
MEIRGIFGVDWQKTEDEIFFHPIISQFRSMIIM